MPKKCHIFGSALIAWFGYPALVAASNLYVYVNHKWIVSWWLALFVVQVCYILFCAFRSERNKNGAVSGIPHSSSDPTLLQHTSAVPGRVQRGSPVPQPQSHRVTSPVMRVTSPRTAPVGEMKLERGPVRQFKQVSQPPKPTDAENKPKNFNARPRPFGVPPPPPQPPQPSQNSQNMQSEDGNSPDNKQTPNTVSESRTDTKPQINDPRTPATDDAKSGREMMNSSSIPQRAYPATPIMGRQQLNSNSGPGSPKHVRGNNNMSPQHQPVDQQSQRANQG